MQLFLLLPCTTDIHVHHTKSFFFQKLLNYSKLHTWVEGTVRERRVSQFSCLSNSAGRIILNLPLYTAVWFV